MIVDVLTLFPGMFAGPFGESILGRAQKAGLWELGLWDIREFTTDRHRTVDDTPYGGGLGMVMKVEPVVEAVEHVRAQRGEEVEPHVVLLAPQGRRLTQTVVEELAQKRWLIVICGHYEGIDDRVRTLLNTDVVSLGDFVLTGGEPAAIALVDAVVRLQPGVLGKDESAVEESFAGDGLLEYPQFTRPPEFRGAKVPDILLSGNHEAIRIWRRKESLRLTWRQRPELLEQARLTEEDRRLLDEIAAEEDTAVR